jgi:hypothetical protein
MMARVATLDLVPRVLAGETRAIARLLTRAEAGDDEGRPALEAIYRHAGHAHVVGITGVPGSGKSTMVSLLAARLRKLGHKVGIHWAGPALAALDLDLPQETPANHCVARLHLGVEDVSLFPHLEGAVRAEVLRDCLVDRVVAQVDVRAAAFAHRGLRLLRDIQRGGALEALHLPGAWYLLCRNRFWAQHIALAEVLLARREGRPPDPRALSFPTAEDGLKSVATVVNIDPRRTASASLSA